MNLQALLELLQQDRELVDLLFELELLHRDAESFADEDVECALVARTLVRELEVNGPGVEIILRMRSELLATRRQVAELLAQLRDLRRSG
jgi:hypothetical protein